MTKTLSFFLTALLLLALLAGCGANAPAPQPAEEQPVPAEDVPVQSGASLLGGWTVPDSFALTDENRPDAVIFDFNELKEIFPEAPHVAWDKVRRV